MSRLVLGINSAHADSSAVLVGEGGLIAAIAEERINRRKHCAGFPAESVREVLRIAGASLSDLTDVSVARDPRANLAAKLAFVARDPLRAGRRAITRVGVHRRVAGTGALVAEALGGREGDLRARFHQVEHHLAHVASAYFGSPFERAAGMTADGAGDFATHMVALCEGSNIRVLHRSFWPHSPGVFYSAVCQFIGFDRFGEEYKAMGLSAYGVNRFAPEMKKLVWYERGRGVRLDLSYFAHHRSSEGDMEEHKDDGAEVHIGRLWSPRMRDLFGPPRARTEPVSHRDQDIAASMQIRFEEVYAEMARDASDRTGLRTFVMAGGCTLNSVANGRLLTERVIDRAVFHPAASDDGTAAGAALYTMFHTHGVPRQGVIDHAYWGTGWSDEEIEPALRAAGWAYKKLAREELLETASETLAQGKITGWFQGREEWGPRALGNRSILCHPGWPDMKATLNARIKNREPFRPFAPAILAERVNDCFHGDQEVPFMIVVYRVRPEWRARLSAITHEDATGRVQTVRREQNALYYDLIKAFERRTGTPVLLNTSFNENEPVVHTPAQAIDCFARTRMDALGIGSFWVEKSLEQSARAEVL